MCLTITFANSKAAARFDVAMQARGYFGDTFKGSNGKPVWCNESRESCDAARNTLAEDMRSGDVAKVEEA